MRTWLLLCLLLLFAACRPFGGYDQDKDIDPDITREVDTLNGKLMRYMASGDSRAVTALCADAIKTDTLRKTITELADQLGDLLKRSPYVIRYRFYANYPTENTTVKLLSSETSERAFQISYRVPTRHSFTTVAYLQDSMRTIAVTTVWAQFGRVWKLYHFRAGLTKVYGKDAIDWYYVTKQRYAEDALADAYISTMLCREVLRPAGKLMQYKLDDDMYSLGEQVKSTVERDLHLPTTLETVKTKPQILGMRPDFFSNGVVPAIGYLSHIPLRDTVALSRECDSVNEHIGEVFYYIEHNNRTFIYRVYNQMPTDTGKELPYYQFVKKTAATWGY